MGKTKIEMTKPDQQFGCPQAALIAVDAALAGIYANLADVTELIAMKLKWAESAMMR